MKRKVVVSLIVLSLILMVFLPAPITQAKAPGLLKDKTLQVVLVLDASGSMQNYALGGDLPEEIQKIKDQIDAILTEPEYQTIIEQQKSTRNTAEMVEAERSKNRAYDAINTFLKENGYEGIVELQGKVDQLLENQGCDCWNNNIILSPSMSEFENRLDEACCNNSVPSGLQSALLDAMPMNNASYTALTSDYETAYDHYSDVYDSSGLSALDDKAYQFRDDRGYYDLQDQISELAPTYGVPSKIELSRQAGSVLVELSRLDELSKGTPTNIALVTFSDYAKLVQPFTSDFDLIAQGIEGLSTLNMTNISDGLLIALDELSTHGDPDQPSVIILLSDGLANRGLVSQDILAQIPDTANSIDTSICALGVGETEFDIDADLLKGLAENTGGSYQFATSGEEIVNFFITCRQQAVGANVTQFTGTIQSGQKKTAGSVAVTSDTKEMSAALTYLHGDLTMELVDPDGIIVDSSYPGAYDEKTTSLHLIKVDNPRQGNWTITVEAKSTPADRPNVIYNVVASKVKLEATPTPTATPTPAWKDYVPYMLGGGVCLLGLGIVVIAIVVAIILSRRKK